MASGPPPWSLRTVVALTKRDEANAAARAFLERTGKRLVLKPDEWKRYKANGHDMTLYELKKRRGGNAKKAK